MQKIALCGYYGMCDLQNNLVGHVGKVTKEYFDLLKDKYEVLLIASPCIYNEVVKERNITGEKLHYDIVIDAPFTLKKRIFDKLKIMKNIRCCLHSDADKLFFYQTDFFFFFYLFLFYRKYSKKIYCLIYHQNFTGGKLEPFLKYIYQKALLKIDGVIYTQKKQEIKHKNTICIPDYIYEKSYYLKYDKKEKADKVVCLGTMNRYKQLEELIEVFQDIDLPLEIYGRFDDKPRYEALLKRKSENVEICDCILSNDEYYQKLGEAKYSILPYDMQQYTARTSGVLLESIYVGSIPVAPKELLEQNGIKGIEYESLSELKAIDWCSTFVEKKENEPMISSYTRECVEKKLQKFFM